MSNLQPEILDFKLKLAAKKYSNSDDAYAARLWGAALQDDPNNFHRQVAMQHTTREGDHHFVTVITLDKKPENLNEGEVVFFSIKPQELSGLLEGKFIPEMRSMLAEDFLEAIKLNTPAEAMKNAEIVKSSKRPTGWNRGAGPAEKLES